MKLSIPLKGTLRFNQYIAPDLIGFKAPGTLAHAASGHYGALLLQRLPPEEVKAWYNVYQIDSDSSFTTTIKNTSSWPMVKLCLAIRNNHHVKIEGIDDIHIREGQANLLFTADDHYTLFYKKRKEYISLDLYYPINWLNESIMLFPLLKQMVNSINAGLPAVLSSQPIYITREIFIIINDIMGCPYDQPFHATYFYEKVRLLLFLILVQTVPPVKKSKAVRS